MTTIKRLLPNLWFDGEAKKAGRVMNAIFTMKKIDIEVLEQAYRG